jgi:hypothetical protein
MASFAMKFLLSLSFCFTLVLSHMEMKDPPPRRSKFNPFAPQSEIDYNMVAPLNSDGSNFPCKGYPRGRSVRTLKAGATETIVISGSATHGYVVLLLSSVVVVTANLALATMIRTLYLFILV